MAWMIREDQLDPDQQDFIDNEINKNDNIWIKGFAGSGKSVLLVHALKKTLQKKPNAKVCVVVFTWSLVDLFKTGLHELGINSNVPVLTYYGLDKDPTKYDYIFCDEVQDLPEKAIEIIKRKTKTIFVAGDTNQSIYEKDPQWHQEVIEPDEIGDLIDARPFTLNYIHRLTRSIINALEKLIPNMNIWSARRDATKVDVQIRLCEASSVEKEVGYVWKEAQKGPAIAGETSAILFPRHKYIVEFVQELLLINNKQEWEFKPNSYDKGKPKDKQTPDYNDMNAYLKSQGLKIEYVGNSYGSLENATANHNVIIMTYYSVKGLDFDNVFVPFVNSDLHIPGKSETLFMVAISRSRKNLYLSYSGYVHEYVDRFADDCNNVNIDRVSSRPTSSIDFDF